MLGFYSDLHADVSESKSTRDFGKPWDRSIKQKLRIGLFEGHKSIKVGLSRSSLCCPSCEPQTGKETQSEKQAGICIKLHKFAHSQTIEFA